MRRTFAIVFSLLLLMSSFPARAWESNAADFEALVDKYFHFYFPLRPSEATQAGFHQYDQRLEDYSAAGQEALTHGLKDYLVRFGEVARSKLPPDTAADLDW